MPSLMSRRIDVIAQNIENVLEPARRLGQDLTLLQARQAARFQSYLLTGDAGYAQRYSDLNTEADERYERLQGIVERSELAVRVQIAAFRAASQTWHTAHLGEGGPLSGDAGREAYLAVLPADLARYEAVLQAAAALEAALVGEVAAAREEMDGARDAQERLSIALAMLALVATLGVGVIGRRVGSLANEAEEGRADALRSRREMGAVLEASADGVVGMDLTGRCTSLNRTGSQLLGMPEHDAQGRSVHDLLHGKAPSEEAHAPEECPILLSLDAGVEREDPESVVWRRDGSSFPADLHLRPLVDGREVRGGVLTIIDMTSVREAEDALRQAVRARDEVVTIVSHDLRSPLGTVMAAADLLADLPLSQEKQEEQIAIIQRASRRMSRLIEDLLDVASIEAGVLSVDPKPVAVLPLIEDTAELFRQPAESAGLVLETSVAKDLPPILADRGRMEQVLGNLVGNALKFTDSGGRIGLEAVRSGDGVRLSVSDTGCGIDEDGLEALFDRFWRVESTGRQGTGLGLTIVRGIVRAHGGRIEVESEVGVGSRFHVEIPAVPDPGEEGGNGAAPGTD
jgi:PAS domain S-box-containing protein